MTDKKTKADNAPIEEIYLDLSTREIVKVSPSGELRVKPEAALFDFYVSVKTYPARNG